MTWLKNSIGSCTICALPNVRVLNQALNRGEPVARVARHYGVSRDALRRHSLTHLPLVQAVARRPARPGLELADQGTGDSPNAGTPREHAISPECVEAPCSPALLAQGGPRVVLVELEQTFARINLLFDACDRWLRDADDPTRYDLGPRADDILVTYTEPAEDGKPRRCKARLSALLDRVAGVAPDVIAVKTKHADPRELVLKTAGQLQGQIELLAKLTGELAAQPTVQVAVAVDRRADEAAIDRLMHDPELREQVTALRRRLALAPPAEAGLAGS